MGTACRQPAPVQERKLKASGTIYDRNGEILMETVDGIVRYHENPAVRALSCMRWAMPTAMW